MDVNLMRREINAGQHVFLPRFFHPSAFSSKPPFLFFFLLFSHILPQIFLNPSKIRSISELAGGGFIDFRFKAPIFSGFRSASGFPGGSGLCGTGGFELRSRCGGRGYGVFSVVIVVGVEKGRLGLWCRCHERGSWGCGGVGGGGRLWLLGSGAGRGGEGTRAAMGGPSRFRNRRGNGTVFLIGFELTFS